MKQLFTSATLRLTGWYLLILACISLLFSVIVYQVSTGEIERRLVRYQDRSWPLMQISRTPMLDSLRSAELADSKASVVGILIYVNAVVLVLGGGMSYLLARRTLRPVEEAHEAQARFVNDASHELRTPLATMTTELEVALGDTSLRKQELREVLASNLEEVQRLNKLSSMLLALSSGNSQTLSQQPFDLVSSTESVVKRFDESSRLTLRTPKRKSRVMGNQPAIEELLIILIENALKYSPPQTSVEVVLAMRDHKMIVRVSNSGDGIAPEHLSRIFDRFYRADSARTGSNGYGLGLALARQISDVHGAGLAVVSTPGVTTEFSFSLPVVREVKTKSPKSPKSRTKSAKA